MTRSNNRWIFTDYTVNLVNKLELRLINALIVLPPSIKGRSPKCLPTWTLRLVVPWYTMIRKHRLHWTWLVDTRVQNFQTSETMAQRPWVSRWTSFSDVIGSRQKGRPTTEAPRRRATSGCLDQYVLRGGTHPVLHLTSTATRSKKDKRFFPANVKNTYLAFEIIIIIFN